nr:unnamed protein product [Callosobruchus chinensis]
MFAKAQVFIENMKRQIANLLLLPDQNKFSIVYITEIETAIQLTVIGIVECEINDINEWNKDVPANFNQLKNEITIDSDSDEDDNVKYRRQAYFNKPSFAIC